MIFKQILLKFFTGNYPHIYILTEKKSKPIWDGYYWNIFFYFLSVYLLLVRNIKKKNEVLPQAEQREAKLDHLTKLLQQKKLQQKKLEHYEEELSKFDIKKLKEKRIKEIKDYKEASKNMNNNSKQKEAGELLKAKLDKIENAMQKKEEEKTNSDTNDKSDSGSRSDSDSTKPDSNSANAKWQSESNNNSESGKSM